MDALPRTGLPDPVPSFGEYERLVNTLVKAECLADGSKIWWDARPSSKFPTLEMRIADVCTRVDDAACIAAVYQCALSFLLRLRQGNQRWRVYPQTLIGENRWRAQRYGITGTLLDLGEGCMTPVPALIDELIDLFMPDAERLGCVTQLTHARTIANNGTSAVRQRAVHTAAQENGADDAEALRAVVDHLITETMEGV
jgi:carboxylate-amine ligase